jgi:GntR family transcriptional regulator
VECEAGPADETERKRLALDDALGVFRMRRLRLLDGKPYLLEQSCFPGALFPDLLQRVSSPYQLHEVACAYGIVPLLARESASEVAADQAVAVRLQVPAGTPILVLDRVVYSSDRVPIEWRLAKCHLRGAYDHAGMR